MTDDPDFQMVKRPPRKDRADRLSIATGLPDRSARDTPDPAMAAPQAGDPQTTARPRARRPAARAVHKERTHSWRSVGIQMPEPMADALQELRDHTGIAYWRLLEPHIRQMLKEHDIPLEMD